MAAVVAKVFFFIRIKISFVSIQITRIIAYGATSVPDKNIHDLKLFEYLSYSLV